MIRWRYLGKSRPLRQSLRGHLGKAFLRDRVFVDTSETQTLRGTAFVNTLDGPSLIGRAFVDAFGSLGDVLGSLSGRLGRPEEHQDEVTRKNHQNETTSRGSQVKYAAVASWKAWPLEAEP